MEIPKALQEEILSVQNKLKNAIRDHQICEIKRKDDPNNTDILEQIREIQLHIVSLGRWQKQVVQQLRKEVESFKAENSLNGAKISVASLLGLNNNNHITNNNETTRRVVVVEHGKDLNGHTENRSSSKEDYEEIVRNGDVTPPLRDDNCAKEQRSSSTEPNSGEDEIVEVPAVADSPTISVAIEAEVEEKPKSLLTAREQQTFLSCLGLITSDRLLELQNKRSERKRRSTANSHFLYSNWEVPTKRKRHAYLQSLGNAPQTRQTTARLNGPSPPPTQVKNNPRNTGSSTNNKTGTVTKSLSRPTTPPKTSTIASKPNILRNGDGKAQKEVYGKVIKQETDRTSKTEPKLTPTTSTGKTVHIPGLPSCLTVERIENDSTVCVACRNPGTLTVCEYCSAKFHVSCHTTSPASSSYCPRCASRFRSKGLSSTELEILRLETKGVKKDKETATAAYAQRAFGKAGENTEVHKAPAGLHKADAAQARQRLTAAALGINQLPASTFLIPIAASSPQTTSTTDDEANDVSVTAVDEPLVVTASSVLGSAAATIAATPRRNFGTGEQQQQPKQQSSILLSKLSQPGVSQVAESRLLPQSHEILSHGRSIFVIGKVPGQSLRQRRWSADRVPTKPKQISLLNREWSGRSAARVESQKSGRAIAKSSNYVTVEVICHDDNRSVLAGENSPDCVYISETSSGVPNVVDLEPPRAEDAKHGEPEVLNISSGSSGDQSIESPQPATTPEHLETATGESDESATATAVAPVADGDEIDGDNNDDGDDDERDDNFLSSIFPGRYGYKIDIVDVESTAAQSSSSSTCSEPAPGPGVEFKPVEQLEHVKLEEAHLSAPLRTELTADRSEETVDYDNRDMEVEESGSDRPTTVPDNKSDDAAMMRDYRDEDYNDREAREGSSDVSEPASRDEPTSEEIKDYECETKENSVD